MGRHTWPRSSQHFCRSNSVRPAGQRTVPRPFARITDQLLLPLFLQRLVAGNGEEVVHIAIA